MLIAKWLPGSHIGFFGFRTLILVWLWISTPNLSGTTLVYMGRSLLIFSDITFKMAAWWPYWIFWFPDYFVTLVWLWISTPNSIWVRAYWFSVTLFDKWLPGGHIRFFGFWMAWFRQRNSSLLWNFSFKFHVHVLCGCRQKPNDCQLCHFVMAALWFWTMFNCNPPIAHCHPLLWGGGILVDQRSTISKLEPPQRKLNTRFKIYTFILAVKR